MNHKWKYLGTEEITNWIKSKEYKCTTCECEKSVARGITQYSRSGMCFGGTRPDCIDWEVENNKTID